MDQGQIEHLGSLNHFQMITFHPDPGGSGIENECKDLGYMHKN